MVFGKSDLHVNQPLGSFVNFDEISGYYNDLSKKVKFDKKHIEEKDYIPVFVTDSGEKVRFPIQIAQYALGCYELFLKTKNDLYKQKMLVCSDYLLTLVGDGGIDCMFFVKGLQNHYSAMCQGECLSLFLRSFKETNDEKYLNAAHKTYQFLIDQSNGLIDELFRPYEYPEKPIVLNGYIFSLFGIFDYYLQTKNDNVYEVFNKSLSSLKEELNKFCFEEWTYYDLGGNIASPFYHGLHIELLKVLQHFDESFFSPYIDKWTKSYNSKKIRRKMFWKKARQKL